MTFYLQYTSFEPHCNGNQKYWRHPSHGVRALHLIRIFNSTTIEIDYTLFYEPTWNAIKWESEFMLIAHGSWSPGTWFPGSSLTQTTWLQVLQENQPPFHCLDIPSPIAANFISLNPSWRFLSSIQLLPLKPPCPFFHQYLCIRARGIHQGPAGTGHNGRTQEEEKGVADG